MKLKLINNPSLISRIDKTELSANADNAISINNIRISSSTNKLTNINSELTNINAELIEINDKIDSIDKNVDLQDAYNNSITASTNIDTTKGYTITSNTGDIFDIQYELGKWKSSLNNTETLTFNMSGRPSAFNPLGNILYTKMDNNLYMLNSNGVEVAIGGSGESVTETWEFLTSTSVGDVGSGQMNFNNTIQNSTTEIRFNIIDNKGDNRKVLLDLISKNDRIYVKNIDETNEKLFTVSATPTLNGLNYVFPVTYNNSIGTDFSNAEQINIIFIIGPDPYDQTLNTTDAPTFAGLDLNGDLDININNITNVNNINGISPEQITTNETNITTLQTNTQNQTAVPGATTMSGIFKTDTIQDTTTTSAINLTPTEIDLVATEVKVNGQLIDSIVDIQDVYNNSTAIGEADIQLATSKPLKIKSVDTTNLIEFEGDGKQIIINGIVQQDGSEYTIRNAAFPSNRIVKSISGSLKQIRAQGDLGAYEIRNDNGDLALISNNATINIQTTSGTINEIATNKDTTLSGDKTETITGNSTTQAQIITHTALGNLIESSQTLHQITAPISDEVLTTSKTITAPITTIIGDEEVQGQLQVGAGQGYTINKANGATGAATIAMPADYITTTGGDYNYSAEKTTGNPSTRHTNYNITLQNAGVLASTPQFSVSGTDNNIKVNLPVVSNQVAFDDNHLITKIGVSGRFCGRTAVDSEPSSANGSPDYNIGDIWTRTSTKQSWVCVDNTANSAVWEKFGWDQSLNTTDNVNFNQVDTKKIINGDDSGVVTIAGESIRIGYQTGSATASNNGIAMGYQAAVNGILDNSIYIGYRAGQGFTNTRTNNTVLGNDTGSTGLGSNNTIIGPLSSSQVDNTVILNSGLESINATQSGFYVKPLRDTQTNNLRTNMRYENGEIYYSSSIKSLVIEDDDVSNQTRSLGQGYLYKKINDPALYWLPDTGGTDVDLTHQALYDRVTALEQLIRDNAGTTELRAPVDFTTF